MKANHLRIGNLLNYDTGEDGILITVIDWQDLRLISECEDKFNLGHQPIELTDEWLSTFGFSDKDYKDGYIGKDFKSGGMILDFVLSKPFSKGEWNDTYTFNFEGHRFLPIKYVHELQNFYFAVTGEELSPINLSK